MFNLHGNCPFNNFSNKYIKALKNTSNLSLQNLLFMKQLVEHVYTIDHNAEIATQAEAQSTV